jgi:hypothetical protein
MSSNFPIQNVDYRVECDDFILYELGRLIDEDRASFEDDEFRRVIEAGIHEHIERRLDIRASVALRLRSSGRAPVRVLRAVEDIESSLRHLPEIIQSYTEYLFQKLEQCSEEEPDEKVTGAADALFDSPDHRETARGAIDLLGSTRSAVSARILAHAVSEPMLDEDIESKAYEYLRAMWPLPRPYILYSLKSHAHEDIPFRWFQLLIDCDEPSAVDRILEELVVHGNDSRYQEDLLALVQLLGHAGDPETEDKILQVLNSSETPRAASDMVEEFLKDTQTRRRSTAPNSVWAQLDRVYALNRQYLAAAEHFDAGRKAAARRSLDELLAEDPQHPLALMLQQLL